MTIEGVLTVPAGKSALLQANESITLKPNFHAMAGSGFHAKWTNEPNYEVDNDSTDFTYDAIGNLIADRREGTTIRWTPYGKVREVLKADGSQVSYRYDGAGNRVAKIIHRNDSTLTTHYVRDASGNVLAIYQDSLLAEQPIYGSSRLGMYKGGRKTGERTLGQKNYELSNHLGNVLAVITDNINMDHDSIWATTVSLNDYYPFGLGMEGRSMRSSKYRFGFNGKEKDSNGEFGAQTAYDYGFRIYNPAIGKFLSVDPVSNNFPYFSPYQFAGLDPIKYIDLDGLERAYFDQWSNTIIPASDFHQHTPAKDVQFLHMPDPNEESGIEFLIDQTPTNEVLGLLNERDFRGNYYNRAEAGAWLVASVVGGKVVNTVVKRGGKFLKSFLRNENLVLEIGANKYFRNIVVEGIPPKISEQFNSVLDKVQNNINKHLQDSEVTGLIKEIHGYSSNGQHYKEALQALEGLKNSMKQLGTWMKEGKLTGKALEEAKRAHKAADEALNYVNNIIESAEKSAKLQ